MKKSATVIVSLAIAFACVAAWADSEKPTGTATATAPAITPIVTKTFLGKIDKIDTKLSTITVKGEVMDKSAEMTHISMIFVVTKATAIKINKQVKAFKDLAVNMVVMVQYQVKNNVNVAVAVISPPPLPGQTP